MGQGCTQRCLTCSCSPSESSLLLCAPDGSRHAPHPGLDSSQSQKQQEQRISPKQGGNTSGMKICILGGDAPAGKIWRPQRQGHLGADLEGEPGEEDLLQPPSPPVPAVPRHQASFPSSATASNRILTHPAALWLVQASEFKWLLSLDLPH